MGRIVSIHERRDLMTEFTNSLQTKPLTLFCTIGEGGPGNDKLSLYFGQNVSPTEADMEIINAKIEEFAQTGVELVVLGK